MSECRLNIHCLEVKEIVIDSKWLYIKISKKEVRMKDSSECIVWNIPKKEKKEREKSMKQLRSEERIMNGLFSPVK